MHKKRTYETYVFNFHQFTKSNILRNKTVMKIDRRSTDGRPWLWLTSNLICCVELATFCEKAVCLLLPLPSALTEQYRGFPLTEKCDSDLGAKHAAASHLASFAVWLDVWGQFGQSMSPKLLNPWGSLQSMFHTLICLQKCRAMRSLKTAVLPIQ